MSILADQDTRVIVQGITGREAASFTKDMLDYGTKVVAGVTPGKEGQRVYDVPVYDTVRRAVMEQGAETSVISVPPAMVKGAALEALANGIKLLVIVTERVPRKDTIEFLELADERKARVIGPNTLGLISPGTIKLGMAGGPVEDGLHSGECRDRFAKRRNDHGDRQSPDHPWHRTEHLYRHRGRPRRGLQLSGPDPPL